MDMGLDKASSKRARLCVVRMPAFHHWRIHDYDGQESVEKLFPWKKLAIALLHGDKDNHLLQAITDGELVIDPGEQRAYASKPDPFEKMVVTPADAPGAWRTGTTGLVSLADTDK